MPVSSVDLDTRLAQQHSFLQSSCEKVDSGDSIEAIRIATVVRVLVHHNPPSSHSLVQQLNLGHVKLLSTAIDLAGSNYIVLVPPIKSSVDDDGSLKITAPLESFGNAHYVSVNDWWQNEVIYRGGDMKDVTRKSIVLAAANKDGGAHIDTNIPAHYQNVSTTGVTSSVNDDGMIIDVFYHHHYLLLRQIGYELMNSAELWSSCPVAVSKADVLRHFASREAAKHPDFTMELNSILSLDDAEFIRRLREFASRHDSNNPVYTWTGLNTNQHYRQIDRWSPKHKYSRSRIEDRPGLQLCAQYFAEFDVGFWCHWHRIEGTPISLCEPDFG